MIQLPELPPEVQTLMDQILESENDIRTYLELQEKAELRRWEAQQTIANLTADLDQIKYQHVFDVEVATDDKGKKQYSNKELREIEVARRINNDENAKDLMKRIREAERLKFDEDRNTFQLRDMVKKASREHSGRVARTNLWAAAIGAMSNGNK